MEKKVIKTVINGQDKDWNGKVLRKRTIVFNDESNGELTLFPDNEEVVVGQELEFEFENTQWGVQIKVPKKGGGGFGGGGKRWSKSEVAQQDAVKITCAALHAGLPVGEYKSFFVECKAFMVEMDNPKEVVNAQHTQPNVDMSKINPATGLPF